MDIGDQHAERDIYNIANLDLNGGNLHADRVYLQGSVGDVELFSRSTQEALAAQFKITYLDFIIADNQKKFLIPRTVVGEIIAQLQVQPELPITGDPGVGKTAILYQLSSQLNQAIYISLKNKSLLTIVSHLVNKVNLAAGLPLASLIDAEAGLEILQGLLASSKLTFMLDDAEANPEVLARILALRKLENQFIYASRNEHEFRNAGITAFHVKPFSFEEVTAFLSGSGITLDILAKNELFEASQGNPLYLYYFTQYQVNPLPKNITDYHQAIWGSLTAKQQQCLIYIALSYKPLSAQVIAELLPFDYPTEAADFIASLVSLVKNEDSFFQIFHPAFKEFITARLQANHQLDAAKNELGAYYLKRKDDLQATHLLIDQNPDALKKISPNVVHQLINEGDLTFATRVMLLMLTFKTTNFQKGYLHYHLAFNFKMLNDGEKADFHQEQSLHYFQKLKERRWYNASLMNKAISMVEDGQSEEGVSIAEKVLERSAAFGPEFEGPLLVNISKMYVDLHENEKAAKASLKAYRSFEKLENVFGMISSLTNLASAIAKLNDYTDIAAGYALKMLEYTKSGFAFNLELVALNILTSVNRQQGNYEEAKKYGQQAVLLCQHYKLENKAILNLVNYGNVLRDAGETEAALKVYEEALLATDRLGLVKDQSRIYWILSEIALGKGDYDQALKYIDISNAKAEKINYKYGIAHGYEEKAGIYEAQGDLAGAAHQYVLSAEEFRSLGDFQRERIRSFQKAILLYLQAGEVAKADQLLRDAAKNLLETGFVEFNHVINQTGTQLNIHDYYHNLTKAYLKQEQPVNLTQEYTMYLEYCLNNPQTSRQPFNNLLQQFAAAPNANRFAKTILGTLIEQSKTLTDGADLKKLLKLLVENSSGFYAREIVHETVILSKLSREHKLEIIVYTEDSLTLKLALALALFLSASPELVVVEKPLGQPFCKVQIIMLKDFRSIFPKILIPASDERFLTYHLQKLDYDIPNYIVVDERYEVAADLITDPQNKHFMYFLGAAIRTLVTNFYHLKDNVTDRLTKPVTRKLAFLFGMTAVEEIKAQKETYYVDLKKLDQLIKDYKNEDGRFA